MSKNYTFMPGKNSFPKKDLKETQRYELLAWLLSGKKITRDIASRQLLIGNLPGRIFDLRERGYIIESAWIEYKRADGTTTDIKQYWMSEETLKERDSIRQHFLENARKGSLTFSS